MTEIITLSDISSSNEQKKVLEQNLLKGLRNRSQKRIDSSFFYDIKGSILFDKITKLKEYYPTRSELEILGSKKKEIKLSLPKNTSIIEFGSGSSIKIQKLVEALNNPLQYLPIDISKEFLIDNATKFAKKNPKIKVTAICADFRQTSKLDKIMNKNQKRVGFFPGSTIGNFSPIKAKNILKNIKSTLGKNNHLIIGVDIIKNKKILENAYNDSKGVTAEFNINILKHLNMRFNSNFNLKKFKHRAFFNTDKNRIEMHLVSREQQVVEILKSNIKFSEGETIHTENSYKYSTDQFKLKVERIGYKVLKVWKDSQDLFSVFCLKVK